ncbi:FUSC family protein [Streptomyces sp. ADMS]|uniref:FUSC family protein n=1 Tax=Streptomyces sp. ADMS TaxID=3071415 RepID=UPI00296FF227|nr:FUSC family protein [Streptomyces sp. ADMS]MDW4905758.1 FUSC family protein [Streptomyces sp. ADMS]
MLRIGRPSDIWFKPALSVIAAVAPPCLALAALEHLDLAMYTMAGALCALYAHNRPYAARARVLAGVVLGMLTGLAVALVTASLTGNAVVLVAVGALLAAAQKTLCDATRIGPPGNVVLTFVSSAALFAPQTLGQVPGHLALAAGAGVWAWIVGMAPGLVRPYGPERRATAHALNAVAAHEQAHRTGDGTGGHGYVRSRAAAETAVQAARQALSSAGGRPGTARATTRRALEQLVVRAEFTLTAPTESRPDELRSWAGELRDGGHVPSFGERLGVQRLDPELIAPTPPLWTRLGPLVPLAARTALGCALAGYASLALGIGRPYWALVTAASLYQANVTLTWNRTVQRTVGNLAGVLLFAALVPLAHLGPIALVLCCLALNFGAEALMSRNYWLGSVCVTPMALLVTEFTGFQDPGRLMAERIVDTFVGALLGLVAAVAVTNHRAGARVEHALTVVEHARTHAERTLTRVHPVSGSVDTAHRGLAAALADLRTTADAAAGEWRQRTRPQERVVLAERSGHRTLAATVRGREPRPGAGAGGRTDDRTTEDVRP